MCFHKKRSLVLLICNSIKNILILLIFTSLLSSCSIFKKDKKEDEQAIIKKTRPNPNVLDRVDAYKNIDDKNFNTILGKKKGVNQSAPSENPLWLASIKTLEKIPLIQANYSSGLIITDWYSSTLSNESIKINVIFKSTEVKATSIDVKSYKKTCNENNQCSTNVLSDDFNNKIKEKIVTAARNLAIDKINN